MTDETKGAQAPTPGPLGAKHMISQLAKLQREQAGWASRLGQPGCAARLNAADNAEALAWAVKKFCDHSADAGNMVAPTAPVEASGSERDIKGETFMGFRVAAWRYRQGDETKKLPHHYAEHWSTPGASAWGIQRLFTEDQLQQALSALALGGQQGEEIDEDTPWPESPLATDLFSHVQSQYGLDNDEASEEAGDIIAILVKHGVDPTKLPARAEAQDEGAATRGWDREICTVCSSSLSLSDIKEGGFVSCCPDRRMVKVSDLVDAFEASRRAHPSPTPAADADRVRIAVEALERYAEQGYVGAQAALDKIGAPK